MNWKNKRVFVTGGAGFIGSHLCEALDLLGVNTGMFIHTKPALLPRHVNFFYGDLRDDAGDLARFLKYFQPEVVFHLAAQPIVYDKHTDETETIQTNIYGTANLLYACKGLPNLRSFVHISTDKVYGNVSPITKSTALNGTGHPYNTSKLAGDYLAQMYSNFFDVPMVIIRHANVYGARDRHFDRIVPRTIQSVLSNGSPVIRGDGSNTRDYLHVSDVIDAYLLAAELPYKNKFDTLNLGGFNHSVAEIVDAVLVKMSRTDIKPVFESQWKGEIPHQHILNDQSLIDWKPTTDLNNGLDKTIKWYEDARNED